MLILDIKDCHSELGSESKTRTILDSEP